MFSIYVLLFNYIYLYIYAFISNDFFYFIFLSALIPAFKLLFYYDISIWLFNIY